MNTNSFYLYQFLYEHLDISRTVITEMYHLCTELHNLLNGKSSTSISYMFDGDKSRKTLRKHKSRSKQEKIEKSRMKMLISLNH